MKFFLIIVFTSFVSNVFARNYYFSSTSGDDTRSTSQAQKVSSPWKSLSKLNSIFNILESGDSVLLKRGDIFYGSIVITKSGSANSPIVISSYSSGALPIITGFVTLSKWDKKENGVFTNSQELADSALNMVVIDKTVYAMGRYPNANATSAGWMPILSHERNNSITTSASLPPIDWTNAELVVRKKRYVIDRNKIISQEGSRLSYKSGTQYEPTNGLGFFIQNHIQTLDQFGEWYYDPAIKKLNVYFDKKSPANFEVSASNINTLISVRNQDNISLQNLSFEGSNLKTFDLYYAKNISIKNCHINFSGVDAVDGFNTENLVVENCVIINSNNNAFDLTGSCNGSQIRNNIIKNTGLNAGMASNSPHSFSGININGNNNIIEYNEVDSSGYIGIRFAGNSSVIKNNLVNYFCFLKDDGGGIYTVNGDANNAKNDQLIQDNIVLNGIGAKDGTSETSLQASGIYLDDNSANIKVMGNSMAYCNKAGLYLHNGHDIDISGNTFYSNGTQLIVQKDAASTGLVRNNSIKNNIFFSKKSSQFVASFLTNENDINMFGKIDENYYSRPMDDNVIISTSYIDKAGGKINRYFDLNGWKNRYNEDVSSRKSSLRLSSYKVNNLVSSNKISNGNFITDISNVHAFKCKVEWQNSGASKGSLRVTSLPNSSSSYITIPVGEIHSGKNYILKFNITGSDDSDESVGILLRQNGSPYTNLATTAYKIISDKSQDYEVAFSATTDEENGLLVFTLNDAATYWLNNLQLYEANAVITNPEDHFLFEYNAGRSVKTISLNGKYVDTQNKTYTHNITLEPFTSAILIKQN